MSDTSSHPLRRFRAEDRRAGRPVFIAPERRTGFDRRRPAPLTGAVGARPWLLAEILVTIAVLSLLDWSLTVSALTRGAVEANPLLAPAMKTNPTAALAFKMGTTLLVGAAIWYWRRYRLVLAAAIGVLVVYLALTAYHVWGLVVAS